MQEQNHNNNNNTYTIPSISIATARTGASSQSNELGMRAMQERAYAKRGEQYLLIKSPPASGKSRALMFIALDKLHNQGLQQAIIVVPERSIGSSFNNELLSQSGFYWDWEIAPQWNLCNAPGNDSKVEAVRQFLESTDTILVCTHATFRFAVDKLGVTVFDNRLIAIDEFHHVSSNPNNKLGNQLGDLIARDKTHIVAMTGSYFRGDSEAVLSPTDEARFETITYTYYEQLNGYQWLKSLDMAYFFYTGTYVDAITKVLNPALKTIIHIPNVNARESLKDKEREVNEIMHGLGEWKGIDLTTGFHLLQTREGKTLKVADLVDDSDAARRTKVLTALKDPAQKDNRDNVDIIIALGMAKEGFDWIWCEHALTVGYRSSLTEIVQIIGRATRDAVGKERTRFSNLIAEPSADQSLVTEAVNDMLKAISASLLMEQVLAPRYEFTPKNSESIENFQNLDNAQQDVRQDKDGSIHIQIKGLIKPRSKDAQRICKEDLNEVITGFLQDKTVLERGIFDKENTIPEELTIQRMGKIVRERYPELDESDQEAVRQRAVAAMNITQYITQQGKFQLDTTEGKFAQPAQSALLDGVRKFVNVRDLSIDLIDRINPFDAAYAVLAKSMNEKTLHQVQAAIAAKKMAIPEAEARELAKRALRFKNEHGRVPALDSANPWERRMAEGVATWLRYKKASQNG